MKTIKTDKQKIKELVRLVRRLVAALEKHDKNSPLRCKVNRYLYGIGEL